MVAGGACTERLATTGECPALCPGGEPLYRDTVLTATPAGDTTYSGYDTYRLAGSLLLANGGSYGQSRAVIQYFTRGDSIRTDSLRPFTRIDSVFIELVPQSWDESVTGKVIDVYRLPLGTDTTATVASIDALMTNENLLNSIPVSGESTPTPKYLLFTGADLAKFTFAPGEPTNLVIGLRLRSDTPTGMRIGSGTSGSAAPSWTTWASITVADTLQPVFVQRPVQLDFSVATPPARNPQRLTVGGSPAARSFVHFILPPHLRDSAIIVRATLNLGLPEPVPGIPGDSVVLRVENLITDLGGKSPVYSAVAPTAIIRSGQTGVVSLEAVSLVRTWQGANPLPTLIRLASNAEAASFTVPAFISTRQGVGPTLRITYRPRFGYGGF